MYESSIFPFILSQISTKEVLEIDRIYEVKKTSRMEMRHSGVEAANLIRLGLIEYDLTARSIKGEWKGGYINCRITDLGEKFVECCSDKNDTDNTL